MAWRRPGDKPLSEPVMVSLLTHICVTWPQRVKGKGLWDQLNWWKFHHRITSTDFLWNDKCFDTVNSLILGASYNRETFWKFFWEKVKTWGVSYIGSFWWLQCEIQTFSFRKIWKSLLQNGGHFVSASMSSPNWFSWIILTSAPEGLNQLNSLAPGRFQFYFRQVSFKLTLVNGGWGISYEIALRWMPPNLTDDKSTFLVQVMAWCRQATSHYLSQCWPRSMSPNGVTRPQWVKCNKRFPCFYVQNFIKKIKYVWYIYI